MKALLPAALALAAALAPAGPACAQTLPPDRPGVPYTIEFEFERFEAGYSEKGKRRIAVLGDVVRDQALSGDDRTVYIADRKSGTLIEFDPADPAKRYRRGTLGETVMPMADGYKPVAALQGPPKVLGTAMVLGLPCTRLGWRGQGEDRQEWCVSAQGIVLSAERKAGLTGTKLKATRLQIGPPEPQSMVPPPGFLPAD